MSVTDAITSVVLRHYPRTQAIYLFGTFGTPDEWPDSDVDVALLLPPDESRRAPTLALSPCHLALEEALGKPVDLVNARQVPTVLQNQIVNWGRPIYCADQNALGEFEMLTLSLYQKLNEERRAILDAFAETGRAYNV